MGLTHFTWTHPLLNGSTLSNKIRILCRIPNIPPAFINRQWTNAEVLREASQYPAQLSVIKILEPIEHWNYSVTFQEPMRMPHWYIVLRSPGPILGLLHFIAVLAALEIIGHFWLFNLLGKVLARQNSGIVMTKAVWAVPNSTILLVWLGIMINFRLSQYQSNKMYKVCVCVSLCVFSCTVHWL